MAQPQVAGKAGTSLEMPRLEPAVPTYIPSRSAPSRSLSMVPHYPQKTA